jgi:tetratricopeptide (TPR) repeat protein
MARTKGSDDLFILIHSLSAEERGYFKKFAKRHTSTGNTYLRIFEVISAQHTFDETDLKKDFRSYARMKVYLKEMIMDSMIIYYRNNHPHIRMLNQIQKIHLLLVKGFYNEALKLLEKSLEEYAKMELFAITRYLNRLKLELHAHTFNKKGDILQMIRLYASDMALNLHKEENLTQAELLSLEWFVKSRGSSEIDITEMDGFEKEVNETEVLSRRAEIKKTEVLNYIALIKEDKPKVFELTRQRMRLSDVFRKKHDSSFYNISALDNHILSCINLGKFDEAEAICDQLIASEKKVMLYYHIAFIWGNLRKWMIYIGSGQFEKGLLQMQRSEAEVLATLNSRTDPSGTRAKRVFCILKITMLFCNAKYLDCWLCLNDSFSILKQNKDNVPSVLLLQMMSQLELGNYLLLKDMAKRTAKVFKSYGNTVGAYDILVGFFLNVTPATVQRDAQKALAEIQKEVELNGGIEAMLFDLISCSLWLESKA